jgi:hypothetical protein
MDGVEHRYLASASGSAARSTGIVVGLPETSLKRAGATPCVT